MFYPADKEGACPTAAPIVDGKYNAPAVIQGQYRVAFRPTGMVDSTFNAPSDTKKEEIISARYVSPSLPADASKDNDKLDFDV